MATQRSLMKIIFSSFPKVVHNEDSSPCSFPKHTRLCRGDDCSSKFSSIEIYRLQHSKRDIYYKHNWLKLPYMGKGPNKKIFLWRIHPALNKRATKIDEYLLMIKLPEENDVPNSISIQICLTTSLSLPYL